MLRETHKSRRELYIFLWISTRPTQDIVESRRVLWYNTQEFTDLDELMYDDYDLDYTFSNDYNLDEDSYYEYSTHDLDEDYERDGNDYQDLAYRHYAWYNLDTLH